MKKFRFADVFNQLYGFPSHLRGAFFSIHQLFVCSNTFENRHELSNGIVHETARFSVYQPSAFGGGGVNRSKIRNLLERATSTIGQALPSHESADTNPVAILLKARIHGFIAQAIAKSDPTRARELIEGAVHAIMPLNEGVRNHGGGFIYPSSIFMASLIPVASEVDPGLAAEICWKSLALRLPATGTDDEERNLLDLAELDLLLAIATLEHSLAAELAQTVTIRGVDRSFDGTTAGTWPLFLWQTIDPVYGQQWIDSMCDRGAAGATSPRSKVSRRWASYVLSSRQLDRKPIMQQAETWMNSTMWTDGFINDQ